MKYIFSSLLAICFIGLSSIASVITPEQALTVAKNFSKSGSSAQKSSSAGLALFYTCKQASSSAQKSSSQSQTSSSQSQSLYYVFVPSSGTGFTVVSADDRVSPVLAYSNTGKFDTVSIAPATQWLYNTYAQSISNAIANNSSPSAQNALLWSMYLNGSSSSDDSGVTPMLSTEWSQGTYYNSLCPSYTKNGTKYYVYTGCVATAMAQIMKYWNYPTKGTGSHSYVCATYGTQSANFGTTTYDWSNMTDQVLSANDDIATLMYHCGVSVDMSYSSTGSGAYVVSRGIHKACSEIALTSYFGYSSQIKGYLRDSAASDREWLQLIKTQLLSGYPVLYTGQSSSEGHAFVLDGYAQNFVHVNWGWGGVQNGYFILDSMNTFNYGQEVLVNIFPSSASTSSANLQISGKISTNMPNDSIEADSSFVVSAQIQNTSSSTAFSGDLGLRILDSDMKPVFSSDTSSVVISTTASKTITFKCSGIIWPGNYSLYYFHRTENGTWKMVADGSNFKNGQTVKINKTDSVVLNSALSINRFAAIQGEPISFSCNISNLSKTNVTTSFRASVYSLSGVLQNATSATSTCTLSPQQQISQPFTWTLSQYPGIYKLVIEYSVGSSGKYVQLGTKYYSSATDLYVYAPVADDGYEINDTTSSATSITPYFIGNTANTYINATIKSGDKDFYLINLPLSDNLRYALKIRLNDRKSSADRAYNSTDALFKLSTDGLTWTDSYDDVLSDSVIFDGGGSFLIKVYPAPFEAGTYSLNIESHVNLPSKISETSAYATLTIQPNPSSDFIKLNVTESYVYSITNLAGKHCLEGKASNNQTINISSLAPSVYILTIQTNSGVKTAKFVKN